MTLFDPISTPAGDAADASDLRVSFDAAPDAVVEAWRRTCAAQSVHQHPCWPRLNPPTERQTYLPFAVWRGDAVVSAGWIRLRDVFGGYRLAAIQRGPVVARVQDLAVVVPALEAALRARKVITLTINPFLCDADAAAAADILHGVGYEAVSQELQNFPTVTAMIDTTQTEDALMAAMTQTGRRHLRKAIKAGVTTRPMASLAEAERANQIMAQMAEETGLVTDSQHDFTHHFKYFNENPDAGSILITQVGDDMFGAAVNAYEGVRGYNILLTTSSQVSVPRAYVLMWDSILAAQNAGMTTFDMVGFPDDRIETDASMKSRGAFKRGFGPQLVRMLPLMSKPLRPNMHIVLTRLREIQRKRRKARIAR